MALPLAWPPGKPFVPPSKVEKVSTAEWPKPMGKDSLSESPAAGPLMQGVKTDEDFDAFLQSSKGRTALVQFGSTWCVKCHEFFPSFYSLAKKFDQIQYAVAQVDFMKERAKSIRYSPTFVFYNKGGKKVDEVLGKDAQRLEDHLWLHSD